jgi:hypothetical protein
MSAFSLVLSFMLEVKPVMVLIRLSSRISVMTFFYQQSSTHKVDAALLWLCFTGQTRSLLASRHPRGRGRK